MKSIELSFSIVILAFLSSCITERELLSKYDNSKKMSVSDTTNVVYSNKNLGGEQYQNLSDLLNGFHKIRIKEVQNHSLDSLFTKIEYDGNKKLKISLLKTDSLITSFSVKVKNNGNYLSLKRKFLLIPIPFIFFVHKQRKAIVFNNEEGDLVIINGESQLIWVLIANGNNFFHVNEFKQAKNKQIENK